MATNAYPVILTPEQKIALFHVLYGDPPAPPATATPVDRARTVAGPDSAQSGYDPSKIASVRDDYNRNVQSERQSVRDWLHQLSQTPPESPDTVKYRLLAQTTRAMYPALVNADIRTPQQNTDILHRIYGDQPDPAINGQSVTAAPVTAAPVTAAPVDHALTIASQASPLPMFAQPHSGAQYQPLSASFRSWTDPHMPPPSNPMQWGDSAPAGHLATTPAVSTPTAPARATAPAPARATAPAAAAPTAPAQSSPGFFSDLFKDPYAGMSPKQMSEAAQRMQSAGDEYGANLLTQRADNAITSSDGSFAQGGSVDENHPVVQRAMHLVRSFLLNG